MIGADILLKSLLKEGVEIIFGYPGGVAIPLYDKLKNYPQIKHILTRHEQGAVLSADGYFRTTGRVGVCLATSGPGATNLITGIANAYMDSIGIVAITCQVSSALIGSDAFQEVDITRITKPITKHNYFIDNINDLPSIVNEAFYLALSGRPRPVHIDIPVDILKTEVKKFNYPSKASLSSYSSLQKISKEEIKKTCQLIEKSERPIVIAGHGISISQAETELKKFIEKTDIPVVTTLLGIGSLSEKHPMNFGMLGMHGMAYANYATHNADLIIGIGTRFSDRITGNIKEFAKNANVIHIDIDPAEIGKNISVNIPLLGDCKKILMELNKKIVQLSHSDWVMKIKERKEQTDLQKIKKSSRIDNNKCLMAQDIMREIDLQTKGEAVIVSDVGQNQMWSAQYFEYTKPNQFLSAGGLGSMGYSLPASIGAKFGNPKSDIWAIMGDGGFQMNMQELGVIMEHKLPIKIIILNNGYLGMVRQWQEMFFEKNYAATKLANPDFIQIAKSYGIEAYQITEWMDAKSKIKKAINSDKPIFLDFIIGAEDIVLPMIPTGNNLGDIIVERS